MKWGEGGGVVSRSVVFSWLGLCRVLLQKNKSDKFGSEKTAKSWKDKQHTDDSAIQTNSSLCEGSVRGWVSNLGGHEIIYKTFKGKKII